MVQTCRTSHSAIRASRLGAAGMPRAFAYSSARSSAKTPRTSTFAQRTFWIASKWKEAENPAPTMPVRTVFLAPMRRLLLRS